MRGVRDCGQPDEPGTQLDPPDQPLDPAIVRSLTLLSNDISETAALAASLTTAVFERTVARYNQSVIVLALSTAGFLASGFVLIFLLGRGSILHFEQWQKAVHAAERTAEARDRLQETIEAGCCCSTQRRRPPYRHFGPTRSA